MAYEVLIEKWSFYQQVLKEENSKPRGGYDGDRVQAHGLAFAHQWNLHKAQIIENGFISEKEFNYGTKLEVMTAILAK